MHRFALIESLAPPPSLGTCRGPCKLYTIRREQLPKKMLYLTFTAAMALFKFYRHAIDTTFVGQNPMLQSKSL